MFHDDLLKHLQVPPRATSPPRPSAGDNVLADSPAFADLVLARFFCCTPKEIRVLCILGKKHLSEPPFAACAVGMLPVAGNRVAFCGPLAADWLSARGVPAAMACCQAPPARLGAELQAWELGAGRAQSREDRLCRSSLEWTSRPGLWTSVSLMALWAAGAEQLAWLLAVLLNQRLSGSRTQSEAGWRTCPYSSSSPGCLEACVSWFTQGLHRAPDPGLVPIIGLNSDSLLL